MKHIKRKFITEHSFTDEAFDSLQKIDKNKIKTFENIDLEKKVVHILTTERKMIQSFLYNVNGKPFAIPEPNIVVIYFSNAQGFLAPLLEYKEELFKTLNTNQADIGEIQNKMFGFYSLATSFTGSLFNSIEALINSKIPKDFKIKNSKRRGEYLDKFGVIRYTSFENKVKDVMKLIYGKNFAQLENFHYNELLKLKNLRDNITHAKANIDFEVNFYDKLYTEALDFDFNQAIESAKVFINYFDENLIEPCDCGLTH